ncbi:MAG: glutamate-5-semialdehyde dehydrogenase [Hyphomicrobium sp.]
MDDLKLKMMRMGQAAREASRHLSLASTKTKNDALFAMASKLRNKSNLILEANAEDINKAKASKLAPSFIDRLLLSTASIENIAKGVEKIADLPDPIHTVLKEWSRPNGLRISRVSVPIGVIGIIYESRPNVTADAGVLCLKSGNAAILRTGSDAFCSASAIHTCLEEGLQTTGLPKASIQFVSTTDRAAVGYLLEGLGGTIDVIVPRGGKSLVERVQKEARVPVFAHLEGICHTYVDKSANTKMARNVVLNAKMRRTSICGATECLLIDKAASNNLIKDLILNLLEAGCEVRGEPSLVALDARVKLATEEDYGKEFLDAIIAVKSVEGVEGAIDHITRFGSHHTDAIITDNLQTAEKFLSHIDSAIILHNASTQFADGGEFGFGAEIGIATGKLHARGPVGLEQLTSFKYIVRGNGQIRPV